MGQVLPIVNDEIFINPETGEEKRLRTTTREVYYGRQFWKFYKENVMPVLQFIGNKPVKIFAYILDNLDERDNTFTKTYKEISEDVNVNESTIAITMKKLQECGFITFEKNGKWIVNPNMLYKGDDDRRHKIIRMFDEGRKQIHV